VKSTLPSLNAKSLLLDLLRMVHPLALPVGLLVRAGCVLGINENAIRVNITRLLAKAQLEQDERGYYRLGKESVSHDTWLRQWQSGESRVKPWKGDWLLLNSSSALKTKEEQSLMKMAHYFGFRELIQGVWVRPNNLSRSTDDLAQQIAALSHINDFVIVESNRVIQTENHKSLEALQSTLWNRQEIETQYQEIISLLENGIAIVDKFSAEEAFKASYFVGAEVHHRLA